VHTRRRPTGAPQWRLERKPTEIHDPPRRRKLRRPHHVELQNVRIGRVSIQPLDKELVPLIRGVGR
jgi:hypothetical protein